VSRRYAAIATAGVLLLGQSTSLLFAAPSNAAVIRLAPTARSLMAVTGFDSLVVESDGQPYGAGVNASGELTGSGPKTTLTRLRGLPKGVTAKAVALGFTQSLVLGSDSVAYQSGVVPGVGSGTSVLVALTGLPSGVTASAIAAGRNYSLVLGSNGVVYGIGFDEDGDLTGSGTRTTLTALTGLPSGVHATAVAAGQLTTVVLGSDGVVYGTGNNGSGSLTGTSPSIATLTPLSGLPAGVRATGIAESGQDTLVLGSDGQVYGAGDNSGGQLTGTASGNTTLTVLSGLPTSVEADAVATDSNQSLVLGSNGTAYTAGTAVLTGVATTYTLTRLTPSIAASIEQVACGGNSELVRDVQGIAYGRGDNSNGQLTASVDSEQADVFEVLGGQRLMNVSRPVISGARRYGATLRASDGSWNIPPTNYDYQWRRDGKAIAGAITRTYKPTVSQIGDRFTVTVTALRAQLDDGAATSAATTKLARGPALRYAGKPKPAIRGNRHPGHAVRIIHVAAGGFAPHARRLSYQWLLDGRPIGHAVHARYVVRPGDAGRRLSVRVRGTRRGYRAGSYTTKAVTVR
jgi:alpha-tubulin suppressor-like RCC1 family protein